MKPLAIRALLTAACAVCIARPAAAQLPAFEVLYEFGNEAANPGPLIEASDGNFYGTTAYGGIYGRGTIFRMTRDYRVSILYEFSGAFDGGYPVGKLLQASDGHLYGATVVNGAYDQGILYRFSLDGEFKTLHHFNNALDASSPTGSLVQGADGSLYGTTRGGPSGAGTVFRATLEGDVAVLYAFGASPDTRRPGPLLRTSEGSFFGKTGDEYSSGAGAVFRMTPSGDVTILHRFPSLVPGSDSPVHSSPTLVEGSDGNIYGNYGCGAGIFRLTPDGAFSTLTSVDDVQCLTLGPPVVDLVAGADGLLYGSYPGDQSVFAIDLNGVANRIHHYGPAGSDALPLIQSINGHLYGTTVHGGSRGRGRIVRITPRAGQVMKAGGTSIAGAAVRLTWSPVANADSYTVKRRGPDGVETVVASGMRTFSLVDGATSKGQRDTYVITAVNAFGESLASHDISIIVGRATAGDFDGDGVTDPAIFRPSTGEWHIRGAAEIVTWGTAGDVPVAADYDGDGRVDIAVFRPSTGVWYIRGIGSIAWGTKGDVPLPGYYRGRDAVDLAVFRPSTGTWYIRGLGATPWGAAGDGPAPGDYDGDGRTDLAVSRSSQPFGPADGWYILHATGTGLFSRRTGFLSPAGQTAAGDYDGDGKTDIAASQDFASQGSLWSATLSTSGAFSLFWGGTGDSPVPSDYDGDGLTDIAVFRESTGMWYVLFSGPRTSPETAMQFRWGGPGDIPIQKAP